MSSGLGHQQEEEGPSLLSIVASLGAEGGVFIKIVICFLDFRKGVWGLGLPDGLLTAAYTF